MGHPQVSVVMSVYKEPLEWITQSIDSILNQTYSNFQFLIINDNPFDLKLRDFLNQYQTIDSRIIVINNKENIGLTKSLNIGLKQSEGKYIARMDADDISYPKRFEKQVEYMESHPEVIVCGTKVKAFGRKSFLSYDTAFERDEDIRGQMILNSGFAHPSVFIRKEILITKGIFYDENYKTAQDYKLWYDLRAYGKFANLGDILLKYRCSTEQVSYKNKTNQSSNRDIIRNLFKNEYLSELQPDNHSYKTTLSYIIREQAFYEGTFKIILKYWMNHHTAATVKEKVMLTIRAIKQNIL